MKKLFFVLFLLMPLSLFAFHFDAACVLGIENRMNFEKQNSAPSPLKFQVGFGVDCSFTQFFRLSPSIVFSSDYYSWNENFSVALPAEVERRTALVFSGMMSLPLEFYIPIKKVELFCGMGMGCYFRYGFLANAVESVYEDEVKKINSYFYENCNWLYPFASLGITIKLSEQHKIGFILSYYYPFKNFLESNPIHSFQDSLLALCSKVYF